MSGFFQRMFDSKWCVEPQSTISEDAKLWVQRNLAGIGALHELIIKGKSICRLRKSTAQGAGSFRQAVREHSECFLCIYYPLTHMAELMQHRGSCWRSLNATVKEREWSVCVPLHISEGRQLAWVEAFYTFFDLQPTFFGTYKYGYVSNCVKTISLSFLFLPDFPFLDNELIYVTSECPELGGTSKEAQIFLQSYDAFSLWLNIDGTRKTC